MAAASGTSSSHAAPVAHWHGSCALIAEDDSNHATVIQPDVESGAALHATNQVQALVGKTPMVPVHAGHWSRLPNRD
jgi:hypothetical protein